MTDLSQCPIHDFYINSTKHQIFELTEAKLYARISSMCIIDKLFVNDDNDEDDNEDNDEIMITTSFFQLSSVM